MTDAVWEAGHLTNEALLYAASELHPWLQAVSTLYSALHDEVDDLPEDREIGEKLEGIIDAVDPLWSEVIRVERQLPERLRTALVNQGCNMTDDRPEAHIISTPVHENQQGPYGDISVCMRKL